MIHDRQRVETTSVASINYYQLWTEEVRHEHANKKELAAERKDKPSAKFKESLVKDYLLMNSMT